jgi:hypothetical protein
MVLFYIILFGQFIAGRGDFVKYSYKEYRLGDSLLTIKEEKKILIKTEDAKEEFGTLVFPYDDSTENIKIIYARTISPDGDTINVPENAINRVADPIIDAYPFLKNRKELHISFVSIKPGSTIEYCIERTVRNFEYVDGIEYFRTTIPVEYSKMVFYFSPGAGLRFQKGNVEGYDHSERLRDSSGCRIYEFEVKDLPEIFRNRWGGYPPQYLISPYVIFSTFPTWDSLAHYLLAHYKRIESIKPQKFDLCRLEELSKKINSPEDESFKIQGYVPLNRERSASFNSMTYPEEILKLISSFEGLSPAFVLRYGFDTLKVIPALSAIESIILYDGKSFLYPFQGEKKILSAPYEGHVAIVLLPDLNSYSVQEVEGKDVYAETLIVNIPKKLISFSKWIPSCRFLGSFSRSWSEEEEELENIKNFVSPKEFAEYGVIKDFKAVLKNQKDVEKPYYINGKVRLKSIGSQSGRYLILNIPEMPKIDPELFRNGFYLGFRNVLKREVCFIVKIPKGYIIKYVPPSVSYSDRNLSMERDLKVDQDRVTIQQRIMYFRRYIGYSDLIKINGTPEVKDFWSTHVVILERKH